MRAAVWHGRRDVHVEDVPEPQDPRGEDVLLEVGWTGICGTDLHEYLAGPIFIPSTVERVVLGHEFSARVVATGDQVTHVRLGDRVTVVPHQVCRTCHFCRRGMLQHCQSLELIGLSRDGAFARYTVARQDQLKLLPPTVSDEKGALVEPLAVALRAVQLPGVRAGDDVAIVGAGPIGLSAVATARATGLGNIFVVETVAQRAAVARELGATATIDPTATDAVDAIRDLTEGRGVDVSIECVGRLSTMNLAIELARTAGLVVLLGIAESAGDLDLHRAVVDEKRVRGCIGYFDGEWETVIGLLATSRLDPSPLISHRLPLEDIVAGGFDALDRRKDAYVKVLVHP